MAQPKYSLATVEHATTAKQLLGKIYSDSSDGRLDVCRAINEPFLRGPDIRPGHMLIIPHGQNFSPSQVDESQQLLNAVNSASKPMSPRDAAFHNQEAGMLDFIRSHAQEAQGAAGVLYKALSHFDTRLDMFRNTLDDLDSAYRNAMQHKGMIGSKSWQQNVRAPILQKLNSQVDSFGKRMLLQHGKEKSMVRALGINHKSIGGGMTHHGSKAHISGLAETMTRTKKISTALQYGGYGLIGLGATLGAMDAHNSFKEGAFEEGMEKTGRTAAGLAFNVGMATKGKAITAAGTKFAGGVAGKVATGVAGKMAGGTMAKIGGGVVTKKAVLALAAATGPAGFIVAGVAIVGAGYLASRAGEEAGGFIGRNATGLNFLSRN